MSEEYTSKNSTFKKILSFILAIIIGFGTFFTMTVISSDFSRKLRLGESLTAYASYIENFDEIDNFDVEKMKNNPYIIELINYDGTHTIYQYSEPITYSDNVDNLHIKNTKIIEQDDKVLKNEGYFYTNQENDIDIDFSKASNNGTKIGNNETNFVIFPNCNTVNVGEVSNSTENDLKIDKISYSNVFGENTDYSVISNKNGITNEIKISENTQISELSFRIKTNNCQVKTDEKGALFIEDNDNNKIFELSFSENDTSHFVNENLNYSSNKINNDEYIITISNFILSDLPTTVNFSLNACYEYNSITESPVYSDNNFNENLFRYVGKADTFEDIVLTKLNLSNVIAKNSNINEAKYCINSSDDFDLYPFGEVTGNESVDILPDAESKFTVIENDDINFTSFDITSEYQESVNIGANYQNLLSIKENDISLLSGTKSNYSVLKPYVVINYTPDETAPQATVERSISEWTNGNVELIIKDAADDGTGLSDEPYSFSANKEEYYWSDCPNKSFSYNTTVYVSVRDNAGNINTETINIDNIDNDKPEVVSVTEEKIENGLCLSAEAEDSLSNIKCYSFSTVKGSYYWQDSNIKAFTENTNVYVCAMDNAGNISKPYEFTVEIGENSADNGSITAESNDLDIYTYANTKENEKNNTPLLVNYQSDDNGNVIEWVKNVKLTADTDLDVSQLPEEPYSFSTAEGEYNWQTDSEKTVTQNGTYYIYVKDISENITLLDTVTINNIDAAAPTISDIQAEDNGDITTITIIASDSQSGITGYSIDNGKTWQSSNVFEIEKDSLNFISVKVKDKLDNKNIITKYYDFYIPKFYVQNGYIYAYSTNLKHNNNVYYYKTSSNGSWKEYTQPIKITDFSSFYLSFHTTPIIFFQNNVYKHQIEFDYWNNFDIYYQENAADINLKYNNLLFDVARNYDNGVWQYSYNSNVKSINDNILLAVLPSFDEIYFVKQDKYTFTDYSGNYILSVTYDENDENIVEYCIKADNINYHYNYNNDTNFLLSSIEDCYGNAFYINRLNNEIHIIDNAQRDCVITNYEYKTTIKDYSGGIIEYNLVDGNIVTVKDQSGVIVNKYEYSNNKIVKNNFMSIIYDEKGRVEKYQYDNGAYIQYSYSNKSGDLEKGVISSVSSTGGTCVSNYDIEGRICKTTDEDGNITEYEYADEYSKITKNGELVKQYNYLFDGYYNYINDIIASEIDAQGNSVCYYYGTNNEIIGEKSDDGFTRYVYDDYGNIIKLAELKEEFIESLSNENANSELTSEKYSITEYVYENGLLTESTNETNSSTVKYNYDSYGNTVKTTNSTVVDNQTVLETTETEYDVLGRVVSEQSDSTTKEYSYDAAGRILLTVTDGDTYERTVYDNLGRTVQIIESPDYDSSIDDLTAPYPDSDAGDKYVYDNSGNLIKEINRLGIETEYSYTSEGNLLKKHYDIYDYYYTIDGYCDKIEVNGTVIEDYEYNIKNKSIETEDGQYLDKVTYANGYSETVKYDDNANILAKYYNDDGVPYYYISTLQKPNIELANIDTQTRTCYDTEINQFEKHQLIVQGYYQQQYYKASTADDVKTINEIHFNNSFDTTINGNSTIFTSANTEMKYTVEDEGNSPSTTISNESNSVLVSNVSFDEENDIIEKWYASNNFSFAIGYDSDGNIEADDNNCYTYNSLGELIETTGIVEASYTYDNRNNMISKTVDGETTLYSYDNENWQDQLTSVNGNSLTYDKMGNLLSYGNKSFTWNRGRCLKTFTAGNETYQYTYDENGYRAKKVIGNDETLYNYVNGTLTAQKNNEHLLYFQYKNNTPVGFICDGVQYLYITNLYGDIVGIANANGRLIAQYTYDEWGKILSIDTAVNGNEEQLEIAQINPLRYRGYYYDNESGLYYLQSRYYDPELGRFISADSTENINTNNVLALNAYIYCWNSPIAFSDSAGTYPKLSINTGDITAIFSWISKKTDENIDNVINGINKLVDIFHKVSEKYKAKRDNTLKKIDDFFANPIESINSAFDKLKNSKIVQYISNTFNSAKELLIEKVVWIKELHEFVGKIKDWLGIPPDELDISGVIYSIVAPKYYSSKSNTKTTFGSATHVVAVVITEIFTCLDLQEIAAKFKIDFKFSNLSDYLQKKVDLYRLYFDNFYKTASKAISSKMSGFLSSILGMIQNLPVEVSAAITTLPYFTNIISDYSGRYSSIGSNFMALFDIFVGGIVDIGGKIIDSVGFPAISALFSLLSDNLFNIEKIREKAEYLAYNWYYLIFVDWSKI